VQENMFGSNFKKFNSILILFLVYISLKNITKFTDDDIEMPSQDYPYNLSQDDLSSWNSADQGNINIVLDEDKNLVTSDLESEINKSLKKRFELRKRTESSNDFQDIANYIDTEVASDYVYDQNDVNLTLVPVDETILFSGVPEPKIKPPCSLFWCITKDGITSTNHLKYGRAVKMNFYQFWVGVLCQFTGNQSKYCSHDDPDQRTV